jgi:hypothetical protein
VIIGLLLAIAGTALILKHAVSPSAVVGDPNAPLVERIAVVVNGGLALGFLVVMLVLAAIRGTSPQYFAASVSILMGIAAPLILWRTRWRGIAEGMAIIALGVLIYLSSASYGLYLIPFAILLIVGAAKGLKPVPRIHSS